MSTSDPRLAVRLRDLATTLQKNIDYRNKPRLENTPKRAREAASQRQEARRLEKVQAVLRGLADVQERGQVNPLIQFVTTRKQVEHILSGYNLTSQESHALPVLIALCDPAAGQVTDADKIKEFAWE